MAITRLNHAVLYVRNVATSVDFYGRMLGFKPVGQMTGAAFLQASGSTNDHDLGLFEVGQGAGDTGAGKSTVGLYHLAWEVDTLDELVRIRALLQAEGALVGATNHGSTKALYAKDPDGLEFEVCWLVPADRLTEQILADRQHLRPLDLDAEIAAFGGSTLGGIGISIPVPVSVS